MSTLQQELGSVWDALGYVPGTKSDMLQHLPVLED